MKSKVVWLCVNCCNQSTPGRFGVLCFKEAGVRQVVGQERDEGEEEKGERGVVWEGGEGRGGRVEAHKWQQRGGGHGEVARSAAGCDSAGAGRRAGESASTSGDSANLATSQYIKGFRRGRTLQKKLEPNRYQKVEGSIPSGI